MTRKIHFGQSNLPAARMPRRMFGVPVLLLGTLTLGFTLGACGGPNEADSTSVSSDALVAALVACDLYDGSVDKRAEIRACTPAEERHKTTICHIPPGNPANAHTLCVGNAAVPAHLDNHGDYLGPCKTEQPCPPPVPPKGTGGASGDPGPGTGGAPAGGSTGSISIG